MALTRSTPQQRVSELASSSQHQAQQCPESELNTPWPHSSVPPHACNTLGSSIESHLLKLYAGAGALPPRLDVSFQPPEWSSRQPLGYFAMPENTATSCCPKLPLPGQQQPTSSMSGPTVPTGHSAQQDSSHASAHPDSVGSAWTAPQLLSYAKTDAIAQLQEVLRAQNASGLAAANQILSEGECWHPDQSASSADRAAQSSAGQDALPTPFGIHRAAFTADTAQPAAAATESAPNALVEPACSRPETTGLATKQEWSRVATDMQPASVFSVKSAGLGFQAEAASTCGFNEGTVSHPHVQDAKHYREDGASDGSAENFPVTVKLQAGQHRQNYECNEEERRKIRRRVTNRESAKRIREKREEEMQVMRRQVIQLEAHKAALATRMATVEDSCYQLTGQLNAMKQAWCSACIENVKLYKKIFELRKALNPGAADSILASWMVLGKVSSEDVSATAETNGPAKHVQGAPTMTGSQAATAAAEDGCALLQQSKEEQQDMSVFIKEEQV